MGGIDIKCGIKLHIPDIPLFNLSRISKCNYYSLMSKGKSKKYEPLFSVKSWLVGSENCVDLIIKCTNTKILLFTNK